MIFDSVLPGFFSHKQVASVADIKKKINKKLTTFYPVEMTMYVAL